MIKKPTVYFFIGTTAELIKLAPVIKECKLRKLKVVLVSSGQNIINIADFFSILGQNKWDIVINLKPIESSIFKFVFWLLKSIFVSLQTFYKEFKINPETKIFVVHGDTVSSVLGAFVGWIYRVPVVHVEAGLRSFNIFEPFPEEINRIIVSNFASMHFCPNEWSINNLKNKEGIKINTFYNTLIETLYWCLYQESNYRLPFKRSTKYFVLIVHRQENLIFNKARTIKIIKYILDKIPDGLVPVFILHAVTQKHLGDAEFFSSITKNKNIVFLPRLKMQDFVKIAKDSEFLITDGGSNQEEMYYLGVPCLLLRNVTERIEGLGENVVLSRLDKKVIIDFIKNYKKYKTKAIVSSLCRPSRIIVNEILNLCAKN